MKCVTKYSLNAEHTIQGLSKIMPGFQTHRTQKQKQIWLAV
jgi:hypothetical protein